MGDLAKTTCKEVLDEVKKEQKIIDGQSPVLNATGSVKKRSLMLFATTTNALSSGKFRRGRSSPMRKPRSILGSRLSSVLNLANVASSSRAGVTAQFITGTCVP